MGIIIVSIAAALILIKIIDFMENGDYNTNFLTKAVSFILPLFLAITLVVTILSLFFAFYVAATDHSEYASLISERENYIVQLNNIDNYSKDESRKLFNDIKEWNSYLAYEKAGNDSCFVSCLFYNCADSIDLIDIN